MGKVLESSLIFYLLDLIVPDNARFTKPYHSSSNTSHKFREKIKLCLYTWHRLRFWRVFVACHVMKAINFR